MSERAKSKCKTCNSSLNHEINRMLATGRTPQKIVNELKLKYGENSPGIPSMVALYNHKKNHLGMDDLARYKREAEIEAMRDDGVSDAFLEDLKKELTKDRIIEDLKMQYLKYFETLSSCNEIHGNVIEKLRKKSSKNKMFDSDDKVDVTVARDILKVSEDAIARMFKMGEIIYPPDTEEGKQFQFALIQQFQSLRNVDGTPLLGVQLQKLVETLPEDQVFELPPGPTESDED